MTNPDQEPVVDPSPSRVEQVNWPTDWRTTDREIPGRDCVPNHPVPPYETCSDGPCQRWLEQTSVPTQCDNGHAHSAHYWNNFKDPWHSNYRSCSGRQYCDSKIHGASMIDLDRAHKIPRPGVSVLIAAHPARFRGPALLGRALTSVVAQTLLPSAIHVVNDHDRQGAGWTRRTLLDHVDTEWVAWLDSDDEWMPEHLEKLFRVAVETDSVFVFSWFTGGDPLGHFGLPFNPCTPHHTTMNVLVRTDIAREVGFPDNEKGLFANEDWAFITGVAQLACERGLKMTHLAEKTWHYYQAGQNSSGQPGQGDAR